jgi:hypothetical protein
MHGSCQIPPPQDPLILRKTLVFLASDKEGCRLREEAESTSPIRTDALLKA